MTDKHVLFVILMAGLIGCSTEDGGGLDEAATRVVEQKSGGIALPILVMPTSDPTGTLFTDGGFVESRTFPLTKVEQALLDKGGTLILRGHRLGYRDGYMVDSVLKKDGKASVRINGGGWVVLENADTDIVVADPERLYGGIGGGFKTVRLQIPFSRLCPVTLVSSPCWADSNTIEFRFNGTDGASSGYRVLDFNVVANSGDEILDETDFVWDDPVLWPTPIAGDPCIEEGKALFAAHDILTTPHNRVTPMVAACSDCHAHDGRDLEYYAYSDASIINRSVFHGLTPQEGAKIACYIRSNDSHRPGRPWNPPFQPGQLIEDNEEAYELSGDVADLRAEDWAAGAGLDAVLDSEDSSMMEKLFPHGVNEAQIKMAIKGTGPGARPLNLRTLPVAIQLPDWNSWLPEVHPLDLWNQSLCSTTWTLGLETCEGEGIELECRNHHPFGEYMLLRHDLEIVSAEDFFAAGHMDRLGDIEQATRDFIEVGAPPGGLGAWRVDKSDPIAEAAEQGYSNEVIKRSLAQWMAVKYWEIMREFGLESFGQLAVDETLLMGDPRELGELLSWPMGGHQVVHQMAPHILSNNNNNYEHPALFSAPGCELEGCYSIEYWEDNGCVLDASVDLVCAEALHPELSNLTHAKQTRLKGDYDSTAWYHLQMILHAGAGNLTHDKAARPFDHGYMLRHIQESAEAVEEAGMTPQWESLRYVATLIKMSQMRDNDKGPGALTGWALRDVNPRLLVSGFNGQAEDLDLHFNLDNYGVGDLRVRVTNAFLSNFLETVDEFGGSVPHINTDWARCLCTEAECNCGSDCGDLVPCDPSVCIDQPELICSNRSTWFMIEPESYRVSMNTSVISTVDPSMIPPGTLTKEVSPFGREFGINHFHHADDVYNAIPLLLHYGANPFLVSQLALWAKGLWPGEGDLNDWDAWIIP